MSSIKNEIFDLVKEDLADIEDALIKNLNPYLDLVSKVASHILFSGGKRLRPLLMVLSARICGHTGKDAKVTSTIFEYLHAATLVHDDIVDGASLRRGRAVAHSIWGNPTSVLVGDFLLARGLAVAAATGRPEVIKVISEITESMSQGEIHQLMKKGDLSLSEEEYMEVIRHKTAVLIQGACRTGALISDATQKEETAIANYGLNIGLAFQMADDLLDYTSDTKALGKEVGADLREGKLTLPVIYVLKKAGAKDRLWMEKLIKNKIFSIHDFETLVELLKKYGGLAYTEAMAKRHISKAIDNLAVFSPSEAREILFILGDYVLGRKT